MTTTNTLTASKDRLYIDDNGRVACASHGGSYLASAVKDCPDGRILQTPLGTWEAFDFADIDEYGLSCEICR